MISFSTRLWAKKATKYSYWDSLTPKIIGDKSSILDVRAMLQGKTKVNIEVQIRDRHNMDRRSLFYWSRLYSESLEAGQDYKELPDVIAVNIVDFDFPPVRNSHTRFHLREDIDHDLVLTDALEIHFLNMVQYRKQRNKILLDDPLNRWLVWFDADSPPELIEEVIKMDSAIYEANERMVYVTGDKEAIHAYEMQQMALQELIGKKEIPFLSFLPSSFFILLLLIRAVTGCFERPKPR